MSAARPPMDTIDRAIVEATQAGLPLTSRPYAEVAAAIGVSSTLIDNMRNGKQSVRPDICEKIIQAYPEFKDYLKGEYSGATDSSQPPPDLQAEQMKQIIVSLQQIVDDYTAENATLREEYKLMRDKYIALLEKGYKN